MFMMDHDYLEKAYVQALEFFRPMMTMSYDEMEFCYAFGVKRFIWGVCVCLLDAIYLYFRL